jgi:DNA-binding NtrC family response regulator
VTDHLLIGESPAMHDLRSAIRRVGPSSAPTLIIGPRGSGKELVAQALHAASRRPGPFVAFNACAIADTMFEDALFGHVRGAFTGATADTLGYLAEAHCGTAFFDEVSGIPPANQRKLLRALETRTFRPVGSRADRQSDFRLLSATNDDLDALVRDGRLRADLIDRLSVVLLRVPPLRDRIEDIPSLTGHFVGQIDPRGQRRFSDAALASLAEHDWPGNVRELKHVIERALLSTEASVITPQMVRVAVAGREHHDGRNRDAFERRRLATLMESVEWDVEAAARELGVHLTTVYRRLWKLGLARGRQRRRAALGTDAE